jgi:hypothetical protein
MPWRMGSVRIVPRTYIEVKVNFTRRPLYPNRKMHRYLFYKRLNVGSECRTLRYWQENCFEPRFYDHPPRGLIILPTALNSPLVSVTPFKVLWLHTKWDNLHWSSCYGSTRTSIWKCALNSAVENKGERQAFVNMYIMVPLKQEICWLS